MIWQYQLGFLFGILIGAVSPIIEKETERYVFIFVATLIGNGLSCLIKALP